MHIKKILSTTIATLMLVSSLAAAATDEQSQEQTQLQIEQKTTALVNQSSQDLVTKVLDDGTEYVDLEGRFQMYSKIQIIDGKQVFICNDNPNIDHSTHTHLNPVQVNPVQATSINKAEK